jgi:hypothetical protein
MSGPQVWRPQRPVPPARRISGWTWLWVLLPALSVGVLGWVPILHAALRLRKPSLWLAFTAYSVLTVFAFVAASVTSAGIRAAEPILMVLAVVCLIHAGLLRDRIFGAPGLHPGTAAIESQPAYAAAAAARQRREQARLLATRDPVMARDLRIGRPDLPRHLDDGGLVDVNHMPPEAIAHYLGVKIDAAAQIAQVRDRIGAYAYPEELTALVGIPPETVDWVRDRLIFLRF